MQQIQNNSYIKTLCFYLFYIHNPLINHVSYTQYKETHYTLKQIHRNIGNHYLVQDRLEVFVELILGPRPYF